MVQEALKEWQTVLSHFKEGGGADLHAEAIFAGYRALIAIEVAFPKRDKREAITSAWNITDRFLKANESPSDRVRELMLRVIRRAVELAEAVGGEESRVWSYRETYKKLDPPDEIGWEEDQD